MIVHIAAEGAAVQNADDCSRLSLLTDLDADGLRAALTATGTGTLADADTVWLDLGVLRSRAELVSAAPDWAQRWTEMIDFAGRRARLSDDGRSVRVHVQR